LHLDPARQSAPFTRLPELTTLSARPGETAVAKNTRMGWSSPDSLLAEIPLAGSETVLTTVQVPGLGQTTLAPVCLPYSPEYLPQKPGQGTAALERLAKATGGSERLNLGEVWRGITRRPRHVALAPYLLLAAVALLLLEVFERRTGLLAAAGGLLRRAPRTVTPQATLTPRAAEKPAVSPRGASQPRAPSSAKESPASGKPEPAKPDAGEEAGGAGMDDALSQARQRARRRTHRT
jgi:hypothetical protein